ncbi:MAG: DMT family transporter [Alistipes sp.]|nr:DMT family transporter [Alistipes sp.]
MKATFNNISGVFYAVVSSASFGLIPLFSISLMDTGIAMPAILFYRFAVAAAIMAIVVLLTGRNFRIERRYMPSVVWLSVLYAVTAILLLASYRDIPSGVATTIHFLYPLAVTLIMSMFFKERATITTLIAVGVSLAGVALLTWGNHSVGDYKHGVLLVLVTVATYAIYIVGVMKSRASRVDSVVLTFYVLMLGALIFFLYALATSGVDSIHRWSNWRDIVMLALLCTVLSDLTLILAIKRIGSTMTSILGSMEPMTAVIVGVLYFDERFDTTSVIGLLLIVVAVVLVIVQSRDVNSDGGRGRDSVSS